MRRVAQALAPLLVPAALVALTGCSPQQEASAIVPGSCPAEVGIAAAATIRAQQKALATGDFGSARSYASTAFQDAVTTAAFTQVIESHYGFQLTDPPLEFTDCALLRSVARMTVRVQSSPEQTMTYRVVQEGTRWRIDSATADASPGFSA